MSDGRPQWERPHDCSCQVIGPADHIFHVLFFSIQNRAHLIHDSLQLGLMGSIGSMLESTRCGRASIRQLTVQKSLSKRGASTATLSQDTILRWNVTSRAIQCACGLSCLDTRVVFMQFASPLLMASEILRLSIRFAKFSDAYVPKFKKQHTTICDRHPLAMKLAMLWSGWSGLFWIAVGCPTCLVLNSLSGLEELQDKKR